MIGQIYNFIFKRIDFKSFLIGFLFSICIISLIGADGDGYYNDDIPSSPQFQLSACDDQSAFIIETRTSHLWYRDNEGMIDMGTVSKPVHIKTRIERLGY